MSGSRVDSTLRLAPPSFLSSFWCVDSLIKSLQWTDPEYNRHLSVGFFNLNSHGWPKEKSEELAAGGFTV